MEVETRQSSDRREKGLASRPVSMVLGLILGQQPALSLAECREDLSIDTASVTAKVDIVKTPVFTVSGPVTTHPPKAGYSRIFD